ncbi:protein FAM240B [Cheilinus undulatus]|uniref:protein FAM240B n=1 Tax=Cheilinus undulatus TaxID=241271 RepID=UPI001BD3FABF|nr:protein FAM240B [Cheilinus undulatus]
MNLALIHDRPNIKTFWEKRIDSDCQYAESEEKRRNKSALKKLRGEWLVRLENRTKHLKNLNDNYLKKAKTEKSAEQTDQTSEETESS